MQANIELTPKLHFASWEGGGYTSTKDLGQAVLVASPEGLKLPVLYDRGPKVPTSPYHYLFVVDVNFILAQVSLAKKSETGEITATVSLSRITSLSTEQVQGKAVAKANTDVLFATRQVFPTEESLLALDYFDSDSVHKDQYKQLLSAAVKKALTSRASQKLFWGVPRQ